MADHFSILTLRTHEQCEKAKRYYTEKWTPRLVGAQNMLLEKTIAITQERMKRLGQKQKNKQTKQNKKKKKHSAVDVTGAGSKAWCCKEQYCIGTWNVRSMNQGKLEVVKQEMTRVNIDILAISELKWTRMGEFNSDDHYIYYCGQESLLRNGVAITVNKRVWNAVLGFNLKKDISCPSCVPSPPLQGHQCYHWSMWCFGVLLAPICIQLICIGYRCSMG